VRVCVCVCVCGVCIYLGGEGVGDVSEWVCGHEGMGVRVTKKRGRGPPHSHINLAPPPLIPTPVLHHFFYVALVEAVQALLVLATLHALAPMHVLAPPLLILTPHAAPW